MSRFLRNLIVAARDPGASLQPRVPSLYADLGGSTQDASEPEPLMADGVANLRGGLEELTARRSSQGPTDAARLGHGHPGELDDKTPSTEMLLPRLAEQATRGGSPARHPAATSQDDAQLPSGTQAHASVLLDAARAWAGAARPGVAQALREDSVSIADTRRVDGDDGARGTLPPSPRDPKPVAAARSQPVTVSSARRTTDFETRGPRTGTGKSASSGNDVEIHIGRIEVVAAAPTVRAPRNSAHASPSLGDYLNGRRRPRT